MGLGLRRHDVQVVEDFEGVVGAMAAERAGALITLGDSFIARNAGRVVALAARDRLPAMYEQRTYPDVGGLMCYGPNILAAHRRAAVYVDKILKGARPADLPVEQPTLFDFVINLKTAQALGLTIPAVGPAAGHRGHPVGHRPRWRRLSSARAPGGAGEGGVPRLPMTKHS